MGVEKLPGDEIIWAYAVIEIGVELLFVVARTCRASNPPAGCLRGRNKKLTVG